MWVGDDEKGKKKKQQVYFLSCGGAQGRDEEEITPEGASLSESGTDR